MWLPIQKTANHLAVFFISFFCKTKYSSSLILKEIDRTWVQTMCVFIHTASPFDKTTIQGGVELPITK